MAQKIFQGHSVERGFVFVHIVTNKQGTDFVVRDMRQHLEDVFHTDLKGPRARRKFREEGKLTFNWIRTKTESAYRHERAERASRRTG